MRRTLSLKICDDFFEINVPNDSNDGTYSCFYVIAIYRYITLTSAYLTCLYIEENNKNKKNIKILNILYSTKSLDYNKYVLTLGEYTNIKNIIFKNTIKYRVKCDFKRARKT